MMVVGLQCNLAGTEHPLRLDRVLRPGFEQAHADGGAPLGPAHAAPVHRGPGMKDQPVPHPGNHVGGGRHVDQHGIRRDDAAKGLVIRQADSFFEAHGYWTFPMTPSTYQWNVPIWSAPMLPP